MQTTEQQHAVELLQQLDNSQLSAVVRLLEVMVTRDDDEVTLSPAERRAVAEAEEWLSNNDPIPHERVLAEFRLTESDWEKMCAEPAPGETLTRRDG